jgi:hypothetical protein
MLTQKDFRYQIEKNAEVYRLNGIADGKMKYFAILIHTGRMQYGSLQFNWVCESDFNKYERFPPQRHRLEYEEVEDEHIPTVIAIARKAV